MAVARVVLSARFPEPFAPQGASIYRRSRWCGLMRAAHGSFLSPPHPPTAMGAAERRGTGLEWGRGHSFYQCRGVGALLKTRGLPLSKTRNPRGTKAGACFGLVDIPRVGVFFPRVGLFCPHVVFCGFGVPFSFFLSFIEREQREEHRKKGIRSSTGWNSCNKVSPRVGSGIHGFYGDCFLGSCECWRGFAGCFGCFHASTGGNACVPAGWSVVFALEVPDGAW